MRQNQFLKWFQNIFENFEQDANRTKNNRQCISQRFPDNNPGLIHRLGFIQSFIRTTGPKLKVRQNSQNVSLFEHFFFLKNLWKIYLETCIKHKSEILGTDCVFGMISLESVCNELEGFFQWSYDSCQTKGEL